MTAWTAALAGAGAFVLARSFLRAASRPALRPHAGAASARAPGGWAAARVSLGLRRWRLRRTAAAEAADVLDLAACLAASGLPARRALREAAVGGGGLSWAIRRAAEVDELGGSFLEALEGGCGELGLPEGRSLVRALRSAETLGTPLARVLRDEAERSRERRRTAVTRASDALPFQLALVTTLFFLPCLLVVTLVPSLINFLARW